jgi:malonate-semialdehyde dehydrogenase (acetylating)/methylmalonate-semialdehyde dehydrogenase
MATSTEQSTSSVPTLVGGSWQTSSATATSEVFNPSTGQVIAQVPLCDKQETDAIVAAAAAALPAWRETPAVERARVMFRFRDLIEKHFEELAKLVTREHGKTLPESRAEVQRGMEMVEFASGVPNMLMGDTLPNIAAEVDAEVDAETMRHPVGVCVGITPYNFPFMVPLWMFPVAMHCS